MSQRRRWTLQSGLRDRDGSCPTTRPEYAAPWLEATGGLELPLVAALAAAGCRWWWSTLARFATSPGPPVPAKTDALDAAVLAHFADAIRPEVRPLRDAESQVLNSLTARRHQVLTMLVSEKNRLGTASAVRPRIEAHIAWLEQELSDLDKELRQSLRRSPGARRTTFCAPFPAWGSSSLSPCWPTSPSWALWTDGRSRPWWAWRPSTGTAAPCEADAPSGADAPGFGVFSTWGR